MAATLQPARLVTGLRLMAGSPLAQGAERIDDHERRLSKRPAGGAWLLDVIAQSGLRGRGGAWFPTGRKWAAVAQSSQGNAVVVMNGSEGEPLSSKDRALLSLRPHLVLDGAALAAETVGAADVVLYLSRSVRGGDAPIDKAVRERAGLGGPAVRIVRTAHRYIAGESSAVINRVSGGPSKPTFSLRRSAQSGVDGRPTLVQNAETLAHVAMIARYGSGWFRQLGTEHAPGTMLMTLCGNVRRPGVYEVNVGSTLRDVLAAAGGTVSPPAGALLGGYFGSWLPGHLLAHVPLDPDQLRSAMGASLGCGVVAVLPRDGGGIVEAARILTYLTAESAAQCGPCVNGLTALSEAMQRIAVSQAAPGDLDNVRRWSVMVRGRGACHHPDGAVGQLDSALAAFSDHLSAHMAGRACYGHAATGFPPPPSPGDRWR